MLFIIWINFWNINRTYLFFFKMQNIESNCWIIFSKPFPIINFWLIIYFFPIILVSKWFNISNSFWVFFNAIFIYHHHHHHHHHQFLGWLQFFSFLSSPENQYMKHQILNLFYDICNKKINTIKDSITSS